MNSTMTVNSMFIPNTSSLQDVAVSVSFAPSELLPDPHDLKCRRDVLFDRRQQL